MIAISASFTAEPILDSLRFWMELLGWNDEVAFAPFGQVFQTLLDPSGLFGRYAGGVNVALVRVEDVFANDAAARELAAAIGTAAQRDASPLIVRVCPASPAFRENPEQAALAVRLGRWLGEEVAPHARVRVLSADEQKRLYPVAHPHDERAQALGSIPYTQEYFTALGTMLAREVHRLRVPPCKVIALDCDDTLWSGVCGEDGPAHVVIDAPRLALQRFMVVQHGAGKLLAIASKNNEADVEETFRVNREMLLRPEHFAARRINWDPKPVSLASMAVELGVGLDSFVFVDDNPKESAEAAAELPEIIALTLPAEAEEIPQFLEHVWAFDQARVTAEDLARNASYQNEAKRAEFAREARTLEDFLAGLELAVEIRDMREEDVPRVAQLTQRTNQMNFSARRRSEDEVRQCACQVVRVRDRFGDYGLVGVIITEERADALHVDTFLLSCRALGRGVEHRMLRRVGKLAMERGLAKVSVDFIDTARNAPAREFLDSVGELAPEALASLVYKPSNVVAAATSAHATTTVAARPDYQYIASSLREPAQILAAVRKEKLRRSQVRTVSEPPRTDLERRLAGLWTELLGVPSMGIHDNFFDLGGHSLLAVQLVSRLHEELSVELPLEAVYTGTLTIAELARSIELFELGQMDDGEYAALLAEVEGLSEEEAEALLERELGAN